MIEEWKTIIDYPNYQISNLGNVKNIKTNKMLKTYDAGRGYLQVGLSRDGKTKSIFVHRIVAIHFVPNPHNLPQINHCDENVQNNVAKNLEWCNHSYNQNYGNRNNKVREKLGIKIKQYDLNGKFIRKFNSITEAQKHCNTTHICQCLKGKFKQAGGYVWEYADDTLRKERKYLKNE